MLWLSRDVNPTWKAPTPPSKLQLDLHLQGVCLLKSDLTQFGGNLLGFIDKKYISGKKKKTLKGTVHHNLHFE